jgi:hypothetical protein
MMLIAQLLFTLLEVARYHESVKVLQMRTDRGLESAFADYCSPLWETYRVLGMTAADGDGSFSFREREATFREESQSGIVGVDLLAAGVEDVEFSEYLLLTDRNGEVFEETACAYMKQNLAYETAKTIYSRYESVKNIQQSYGGSDGTLQDAQDAMQQSAASEIRKGAGAGTTVMRRMSAEVSMAVSTGAKTNVASTSTLTAVVDDADNPITAVAEAKKKGVLALVLSDSAKLSSDLLTLSNTVSHRTLTKGTGTDSSQTGWYETVLFDQYLENYLACYTDGKDDRALNYELEYLIGGKAADEDNLRLVVKELLATREALNMTSISVSSARQAQALSLATSLVGITGNPAIIEVVKSGIIAAWAYVESVMDVRTLLMGGRIATIKSDSDWTSNVNAIPSLLTGKSQAKSNSQGLSYREYLGMLLFFHTGNTLAMRAMDVEEAAIQKMEGYTSFQMDHVVCETQMTVTYEYDTLFMSFVNLLPFKTDMFRIQRLTGYSYRSGKEGT